MRVKAQKDDRGIRSVLIRLIAALAACCVIALAGCGKKQKEETSGAGQSAENSAQTPTPAVTLPPDTDYILENDELKLVIDHVTGQITVTDKKTDALWRFDHDPEEKHKNAVFMLHYTYSDIWNASFTAEAGQDTVTLRYAIPAWSIEKDHGYVVPPILTPEDYERYLAAFDTQVKRYFRDSYFKCDIHDSKRREEQIESWLKEYPFLAEEEGAYYIFRGQPAYLDEFMEPVFAGQGYDKEQYARDFAKLQKEDMIYISMAYRLQERDLAVTLSFDLSVIQSLGLDDRITLKMLPFFDQGERRFCDEKEGAYFGCMQEDSAYLCIADREAFYPYLRSCSINHEDILSNVYSLERKGQVTQIYRFVASGSEEDLRGAYEGN